MSLPAHDGIPKEADLTGEDAATRQRVYRVVGEPADRRSLLGALGCLELIEEEFPPVEDAPPRPVEV